MRFLCKNKYLTIYTKNFTYLFNMLIKKCKYNNSISNNSRKHRHVWVLICRKIFIRGPKERKKMKMLLHLIGTKLRNFISQKSLLCNYIANYYLGNFSHKSQEKMEYFPYTIWGVFLYGEKDVHPIERWTAVMNRQTIHLQKEQKRNIQPVGSFNMYLLSVHEAGTMKVSRVTQNGGHRPGCRYMKGKQIKIQDIFRCQQVLLM